MISGLGRALVILASFAAFYVVDVWLMRRYDPLRERGSARNWRFTIVVITAAAVIMVQPVAWPQLGLHVDAWWGLLIQGLGLLVLAGGLALSCWARMHLGAFYDERGTDIQAGQRTVNTGPYAHIRHPCFLSWFAIALGWLLINPALPTLVAAVYAFSSFIVTAPPLEERLLSLALPGHAEYLARTPRFLPRIRRQEEEKGEAE
jgi:protein-S-isoprenylcysteine O-methyltransferase Ste14